MHISLITCKQIDRVQLNHIFTQCLAKMMKKWTQFLPSSCLETSWGGSNSEHVIENYDKCLLRKALCGQDVSVLVGAVDLKLGLLSGGWNLDVHTERYKHMPSGFFKN